MTIKYSRSSVRVLLGGVTLFATGCFAWSGAGDANDNDDVSGRELFAS